MSRRKPEDEPSTSQAKRRRLDDEEQQPNKPEEQATNKLTNAVLPNEGNEEIKIFKLNVDCVQEIFDYLSIKDIHSIAHTCTWMQKIVGNYFQTYLPALEIDDSLYTFKLIPLITGSLNDNEYIKFAQKMPLFEAYLFIGIHCNSLKQMRFDYANLNATKIKYLKQILKKIETVKFRSSHVEGDFYESFLQFCPNLKRLRLFSIISHRTLIGTSNEWLLRSYPTLRQFELDTYSTFEITELGTFFEQNPLLQEFSIRVEEFLRNINVMLHSKNELQLLAIDMGLKTEEELIYQHLDQLYKQGLYKRLHLRMDIESQSTIDRISTLNELEELHLQFGIYPPTLNLNSMTNLKLLCLSSKYSISQPFSIDVQLDPKCLVNLETLIIKGIILQSELIESFIEHSVKLKAIKIEYSEKKISIDLSDWNKKREKLDGARKITVYLNDDSYLATKWGNNTAEFKIIKLKRFESRDWHIPFETD